MPSGYDDPNAEVQRLQQELEKLRLKDLQQEHHIYALTQQLRSRSSVPNQVSTGSARWTAVQLALCVQCVPMSISSISSSVISAFRVLHLHLVLTLQWLLNGKSGTRSAASVQNLSSGGVLLQVNTLLNQCREVQHQLQRHCTFTTLSVLLLPLAPCA